MKRIILLITGVALLALGPMASGQGQGADAVQRSGPGTINWSTGWIYATGLSAPNPRFPPGAQRAGLILGARKDAQRKLLETVKGITITSETVVQDFMTISDKVTAEVHGMINGAIMIGEARFNPNDGTCEVTMAMPIYPNISSAIINSREPKVKKKIEPPKKQPQQNYNYPKKNPPNPPPPPPPPANPPPQPPPPPPPPKRLPPPPPAQAENFPAGKSKWDGLVIDGRNRGLKPALLPVVYNESGVIIYSQNNVSNQTTIKSGIVGYARDMGAAKRHFRVAKDPLVIVARGARGSKKTDPVLSNSASQYIKRTEPNSGYLRNGRVMVVF